MSQLLSSDFNPIEIISPDGQIIAPHLEMSIGRNYLRNTREYRETHNIRQTWMDTTWRNNSLSSITEYNNINLPLEIITQSYISPDYIEVKNNRKYTYDYNSNGDERLKIRYDWDEENEWIDYNYQESYYDDEFKYIGYLKKKWDSYEWINERRDLREYDALDNISYIRMDTWVNNEWFLLLEWVYHYSDGGIWTYIDINSFDTIDSVYQVQRMSNHSNNGDATFIWLTEILFDDTLWVNELLYELNFEIYNDDYYYITNGTYYNWVDSSWVDYSSVEYTYTDDYNFLTMHYEYQGYMDGLGEYGNISSNIYSYDENDNLIELLQESQVMYSWMEDLITSAYRTSYYYEYVLNCTGLVGDINSDGVLNVLDVVTLVVCVLGNNCDECFDIDGDDEINILDVVTLVNIILLD